MTQAVHVKKLTNGYLATCIDGYSKMERVFTEFADLIDFLFSHFEEDKKRSEP